MSTIVEDAMSEGIRLVRTHERVAGLLYPMEMEMKQIDEILVDAPELAPEMNELLGRLSESCDHLRAACAVLQAKVDLL
jgi:hypothetical protein